LHNLSGGEIGVVMSSVIDLERQAKIALAGADVIADQLPLLVSPTLDARAASLEFGRRMRAILPVAACTRL
jgi:hypothetical protein